MEGLNKYLGTDVLITGDVKKEIGDRFLTRYLGKFQRMLVELMAWFSFLLETGGFRAAISLYRPGAAKVPRSCGGRPSSGWGPF